MQPDLLITTPDKNFKAVLMEPTLFFAYDTAELLQLWQCRSTGKTEWRSIPDVNDFCAEHQIAPPC